MPHQPRTPPAGRVRRATRYGKRRGRSRVRDSVPERRRSRYVASEMSRWEARQPPDACRYRAPPKPASRPARGACAYAMI